MKKKLLLVGVAAMGLLAVGVGATSTFAWYQATSYAGKAKQVDSGSGAISVTDPAYSAEAVDLPVKLDIARYNNVTTPLELGHYYSSDDMVASTRKNPEGKTYVTNVTNSETQIAATAGIYHAYYLTTQTSSIVYTNDVHTGYSEFAIYQVNIKVADFPVAAGTGDAAAVIGTRGGYVEVNSSILWQDINGNQYTPEQIKAKLEGTTVNFKLEAKDSESTATRAIFFSLQKPSKAAEVITPASTSGITESSAASPITTVQTVDLHNFNTDDGTIVYFGLYVNGENGSIDSGTIKGDFKVTVSGREIV